jgi:Ni/Co efflux regulator RcnB
MRKMILFGLMAATAIPGVASAQMRHDRQEVRQDRRDLRHDRRELRRDRVAYVAPYRNWRYRTISPGFQLQTSFFAPRYYVTDYGAYNLRAPNRWQRWIRYGDDLVLVNTRTGRVIQVIRGRY